MVVGVAQYRDTSLKLKWADDDALDFYDALIRGQNWSPDQVTLLINGAASRGAIRSGLASISNRISGGDNFVFYFSGHGTRGPDLPPFDEGDGRDEFLKPYDSPRGSTTGDISDDELEALLSAIPTNRITVIIDTSFSGGFLRDLSRPGAIIITASSDGEPPLQESPFLRNSVFTYYLTEGMLGPASTDGKVITLGQAFSYAGPRATHFNPGQHPQIADTRGQPYRLIKF